MKLLIDRNTLITAAVAFVIGLLAGWMLLGWVVAPVQYVNFGPQHLSDFFKVQYVQLIADSFALTNDVVTAQERLAYLGDGAGAAVELALQNTSGIDSLRVSSLAAIVPAGGAPAAGGGPGGGTVAFFRNILPICAVGVLLIVLIGALFFWQLRGNSAAPANSRVNLNSKPTFFRLRLGRLNWPLAAGSAIVILLAGLVIAGPGLAPRDPMALHSEVIIVGDRFYSPPFAPFTQPQFPLGTDRVGRDVLSRLLTGVRPTMIMVTVVALTRLSVGSVIGLLSGWSERWIGRALDLLISVVLSIPILIVAISVVAALGSVYGVTAFVFGLSVTGWAETARAVREQTRGIKEHYYIEAARALGASSGHILSRHVLPQIMPLLSILLTLEISRTLMVTGGLGFLGYYIGGGVWFTVEDFVERNIAGLPELGQMLSTFGLLEPWGMVAAGSVVFLAVLGFNLLGEGLRRRLIVEGS